MSFSSIQRYASSVAGTVYRGASHLASPSQMLKNASKIALPAIALIGAMFMNQAEAGIFSGISVAAGCVGMGILFPASLFWSAAPCYDAAMLATVNPLLP